MHFLQFFLLLPVYLLLNRTIEKHTRKITHIIISILIHSSFYKLNFMLSTCRTNFAVVAPTTSKVEHACCKTNMEARCLHYSNLLATELQTPQKKCKRNCVVEYDSQDHRQNSWASNHSSGSSVWVQKGKSTLDQVHILISTKGKC